LTSLGGETKSGLRPALSFVAERRRGKTSNMMRDAVDFLLKQSVLDDDSGQDLIEYALLVSLVVLVAVGAVTTVGETINGVFWTYISGVMGAVP
jgi:Flp pilus assembly pilin Flp